MPGDKFIRDLEDEARKAGMTSPIIGSDPVWVLCDVVGGDDLPCRTYIVVAVFTDVLDICDRISDVAAAYVQRQQAEAGAQA